jgi:hypothetical protein
VARTAVRFFDTHLAIDRPRSSPFAPQKERDFGGATCLHANPKTVGGESFRRLIRRFTSVLGRILTAGHAQASGAFAHCRGKAWTMVVWTTIVRRGIMAA